MKTTHNRRSERKEREYPRYFINTEQPIYNDVHTIWMLYAAVKEPRGKVEYFVKPQKQPTNVDDLIANENDAEFFVSINKWKEISKYELYLII